MVVRAGLRPAAARVPAEVLRLQRQIALRNQREPPAAPAPGPLCLGQSRGARPGGPGRGERRRQGRCRWRRMGWERLRDRPHPRAPRPSLDEAVAARVAWAPVPGPASQARTSAAARVPGARLPAPCRLSEAGGPPCRPRRAASGTARPQIPGCPGSRPAQPAPLPSCRSRSGAGTPPSAPARSVRPGPAPGAARCPPGSRYGRPHRASGLGVPGPRAGDPWAPDLRKLRGLAPLHPLSWAAPGSPFQEEGRRRDLAPLSGPGR